MKCKSYLLFFPILLAILFSNTLVFCAGLEKNVQSHLYQIRDVSQLAATNLKRAASVATELEQLKQLAESLQIDHLLLQARFASRSEQVVGLSRQIQLRQQTMEQSYGKVISDLFSALKFISSSHKPTEAEFQVLIALINKSLPEQKYPILGSLPYQNPNFAARQPVILPIVTPAYQGGSSSATEIDIQETANARITPEIAALAESLDWNPLNIYAWVTNNIETEWYWGSMKGAAETLRQKSGNDADQSALLIALMRAANFPARYVRGVIEFAPGIERLQDLLGLDDPLMAVRFLQQAGIPAEPIIAGGQISNLRIEHVWVEVYVPYANYRGAVLDEQGKIWLPLDTHLKPEGYLFNQPTTEVPVELVDGVRDDYLQVSRTVTPLEYLRQQVETRTAAAWDGTLTIGQLQQSSVEVLPASLQFKTVVVTGESTSLPADLIQTITFRGGAEDGTELFSLTLPVREASNRQIVLSYEPESLDDQQLIDAHGGISNTPAYLVRLRPVLLIDGERMIVAKDGLAMGDDYQLTVQFKGPSGSAAQTAQYIVGNPAALGIVAQQALPTPVLAEEEQNAAWMLWETAQDYLTRWNAAEEELAAFFNLRMSRPFPTLVTVGGVLEVSRLLDMPQEVTWKGLFIDAGLRRIELAAQSGEQQRVVEFIRLSALQGSVLEKRVFEDKFQVASVCTAKILASANESGKPALTLDSSNVAELLPTLVLPQHIRSDIEAAVHQGFNVTLPAEETTLLQWSGFGYRKENPETGEAGYMLSGMIAGGMTIEEWAAGYRTDTLKAPFTDPPNRDPLSAVHIAKILVNDRQSGIVGQQLENPLAVLVTDIKGRPVVGANVTFIHTAGLVKQADNTPTVPYVETTDAQGIARFQPVLGTKTDVNPSFQRVSQSDTHVTQVGVNLFDATVESYYGNLPLTQPFEVYGRPDVAASLQKFLGDGNRSTVNNPAGSLLLKVFDQYENPVSNVPVTFAAQAAEPASEDSSLAAGYRNIEFYQRKDCSIDYPLWDDCQTVSNSTLTLDSAYHGAMVETLLGNTLATHYTVKASAPGVEAVFFDLYTGGWSASGEYYPPSLYVKHMSTVNEFGQRIDAVKVGNMSNKPLRAALVLTYSDYSLSEKKICTTRDTSGGLITYDCWDLLASDLIQTRKITNGKVDFDPQTGGQTTATKIDTDGLYQTNYTAGEVPALNLVDIKGEAQIKLPVVYGTVINDIHFTVKGSKLKSATIAERTVTLKSGQIALFDSDSKDLIPVKNQQKETFSIYGVDVPTQVSPDIVMLGDGGMARQNVSIDYTIEPQGAGPSGYTAYNTYLDLFSGNCNGKIDDNDRWVGYLLGSAKQGAGDAVYSRGSVFDPKQQYCVQMVLNRGSSSMIRGDKVKLQTLYADLDIDSDNNAGWQVDGTHNLPSRNPLEDQVENLAGQPGKVLRPNLLDVDGDGVPGYADGIDRNKQAGDGASVSFTPLLLTFGGSAFVPGNATVSFEYAGSNPADVKPETSADGTVSYTVPQGTLRLWAKDGQFSRKVADLNYGGDYVMPETNYPLSRFAMVEGTNDRIIYIEAITDGVNPGDQMISMKVDPDGSGPLQPIDGDVVHGTSQSFALIPDYDHNRVLDEADRKRALAGDTFYFWLNDDDDKGELEGSDIPGDKLGYIVTSFIHKLDKDNKKIDGVRDLIDFFPVHLDIHELLQLFSPEKYTYELSNQDSGLNFTYSHFDFGQEGNVGDYLTDVETARSFGEREVFAVTKEGVSLNRDELLLWQQDDKKGVLLFEGKTKTAAALLLSIYNAANQQVIQLSLNLSLDSVEQMFRYKNLIQSIGVQDPPKRETGIIVGEHKADGGENDRMDVPINFPDSECNNKYAIWVHGYNVDGQASRGWQAEMFKRLYWSGSKARFVGVAWYGFERAPFDYHVSVVNAFKTAAVFGKSLQNTLNGNDVTLFAHSLGNMVVSSYLADYYSDPNHKMNVKNYVMVDAAVALEAYLGDYEQYAADLNKTFGDSNSAGDINPMVHTKWHDYQRRLGSSEWHQLFKNIMVEGKPDGRSTLTWRNRFGNMPEDIGYYNFYSTTEEVLATLEGNGPTFQQIFIERNFKRNAWAIQEKWKGRAPSLVPNRGGTLLMGWGFNYEDYTRWVDYDEDEEVDIVQEDYRSPAQASLLTDDALRRTPFFRSFHLDADLLSPGQVGSDYAYDRGNSNRILSLAIPALTNATGGRDGAAGGFYFDAIYNMHDIKNGWPVERDKEDWWHSDIRNVAYLFTYKAVEQFVSDGDLK